jgi:hypothetical protein
MDPSSSSRRRRRCHIWVPPPLDLTVRGVVRIMLSVLWHASQRRGVEWVTTLGKVRGTKARGESGGGGTRGELEETA